MVVVVVWVLGCTEKDRRGADGCLVGRLMWNKKGAKPPPLLFINQSPPHPPLYISTTQGGHARKDSPGAPVRIEVAGLSNPQVGPWSVLHSHPFFLPSSTTTTTKSRAYTYWIHIPPFHPRYTTTISRVYTYCV